MSHKPEYQIHHINFSPISETEVQCRRCCAKIGYNSVMQHMFTTAHRFSMVRFFSSESKNPKWYFDSQMLDIYDTQSRRSPLNTNIDVCPGSTSSDPVAVEDNSIIYSPDRTADASVHIYDALRQSLLKINDDIAKLIYPKELRNQIANIDGLGLEVQKRGPDYYCCLVCFVPNVLTHFYSKTHRLNISASSEVHLLFDNVFAKLICLF